MIEIFCGSSTAISVLVLLMRFGSNSKVLRVVPFDTSLSVTQVNDESSFFIIHKVLNLDIFVLPKLEKYDR